MARIRTIKPSFFTSLTIADLDLSQRLTFIGLWTHVDDEGRCIYDPRLIRAALWPLDDRSISDVESDVNALSESSLVTLYSVADRTYLAVNGWSEHQRINRKTPSTIPPPNSRQIASSVTTHGGLNEEVHRERKGREGNKEATTSGAVAPRANIGGPTQILIGEWLQRQADRPPTAVINQLAKQITQLVKDGIDHTVIREALDHWTSRGLHPSTLPSVVHEIQTKPGRPTKTRNQAATDDLFDAAMQRAQAKEITQ